MPAYNSDHLDEKKSREQLWHELKAVRRQLSDLTGASECANKAPEQDQRQLPSESEWLSRIFDHNPLAMVVSRVEDGRSEQVNPAFLKLFGRSRQAVIGKTWLELAMVAEHDREQI